MITYNVENRKCIVVDNRHIWFLPYIGTEQLSEQREHGIQLVWPGINLGGAFHKCKHLGRIYLADCPGAKMIIGNEVFQSEINDAYFAIVINGSSLSANEKGTDDPKYS